MGVQAEITSPDIVGYATSDSASAKYMPFGGCFTGVGSDDGTFTLSTVKPEGFDYEMDLLMVLNPDDSSSDETLIYLNDGDVPGIAEGWYTDEGESRGEDLYDLGTGFLSDFGDDITFTVAGKVYDTPVSIDCSGCKYTIIVNPLPRKVAMSEVTATNFDYEMDLLMVLNPEDSSSDETIIYLNAGDVPGIDAGWYTDEGESRDDLELDPGTGFMSDFGDDVIITFPAGIPAAEGN